MEKERCYVRKKMERTDDNLIERIDASVDALAWTPGMAYDYFWMFWMSLHSKAEHWIKLICETNEDFVKS